jgi:hypothetical protein
MSFQKWMNWAQREVVKKIACLFCRPGIGTLIIGNFEDIIVTENAGDGLLMGDEC